MDRTKTMDQMEEIYREELREYKIQIDDILNRQSELSYDLQNYQEKVNMLRQDDSRIFTEFLDRQKEISIGLIFSKTGRKITDKLMENLIHRQVFFFFFFLLRDLPIVSIVFSFLNRFTIILDYIAPDNTTRSFSQTTPQLRLSSTSSRRLERPSQTGRRFRSRNDHDGIRGAFGRQYRIQGPSG